MRLKYVFIKEYKNLKDFEITFDGSSFIDVFVGKNGSGKSNFFEAMIKIFRHIVEFRSSKFICDFNFTIKYEIAGENVELKWKNGILKFDGRKRTTTTTIPKPDNVIIYYSGHNKTVLSLVNEYEKEFSARIIKASFQESRYFIGIGPEYKELLLTMLLMQNRDSKAKEYIVNKLGISTVSNEIFVILKRPLYAINVDGTKKSSFNIDFSDDENERYWKPKGITKTFLDRLHRCINTVTSGPVRSEGYFPEEDKYRLYFDISSVWSEFSDYTPQDLFRQFDNLKTLGMLEQISISVKLYNEQEVKIQNFSDGQFQSIYIYSIIEFFKDKNILSLLDEPDAFLHPEWQLVFYDQISQISSQSVHNHILMSTHSAPTLIPFDDNNINLFNVIENEVNWKKQSKKETINELSNCFIQYSEDESKLLIDNVIRTSDKPILFVEGVSDVDILNTAYKKLYPTDDMPILVQDAFDRGFIRTLLSRNDTYTRHPNKKFFGLFDFDDAYEDWRTLGSTNEVNQIELGLCRKIIDKDAYIFMLPIPDNDLKTQVYNDASLIDKIVPKPHFCIEHIFWDAFDDKTLWFKEKHGIQHFKGDKHKVRFAKEIVPTLSPKNFEVFRPIFDFIKSKCEGN